MKQYVVKWKAIYKGMLVTESSVFYDLRSAIDFKMRLQKYDAYIEWEE